MARIETNEFGIAQYDMVFYGDDLVENMNGMRYNQLLLPDGEAINQLYRSTLTYENEDSNINSIAMGISGDSVRRWMLITQEGIDCVLPLSFAL